MRTRRLVVQRTRSNPLTIPFAGWHDQSQSATELTLESPEKLVRSFRAPTIAKKKPPPAPKKPTIHGLRRPPVHLNPDNPSLGKWAVVALSADAEKAAKALRRLIDKRADQGLAWQPPPNSKQPRGVLSIAPVAASDPEKWVERVIDAAYGRPPRYLLLVGGPDRIPFEAQFALDEYFNTGRLDLGDTPDGPFSFAACEEYAEKLLRFEDGEMPTDRAPLLYSFAADGATRTAHEYLALPLATHIEETLGIAIPRENKLFEGDATTNHLLTTLANRRPALVVTLSHGLEMSDERGRWGALTDSTFVAGARGTPLTANLVSKQPRFACGSVFLSFACFSAGIPQRSAMRLLEEKLSEDLPFAPFTAALPRALLAHPAGPIAFVGHVDRATSTSFHGRGCLGPEAFFDFASFVLTDPGTLGQAVETFREKARSAARRLADQLSPAARKTTPPERLIKAWITYHDATGYIILGDPLVRPSMARRT